MPVSRRRARKKRPVAKQGSPVRSVFTQALDASDRLQREVAVHAIASLPKQCRAECLTDPETSQGLLHECRTSIEQLAAGLASELDPYTWLFYLRRLPNELFTGRLSTSAPYRRMLGEVLSATTPLQATFGEPAAQRQVIPPLTREQAEALIRLAHLTGPLASIHAALRRAGKGQHIQWRADDLPWVVPDPALDAAIENYDRRVEQHGSLNAGTRVATFHPLFAPVDPTLNSAELLLSVHPVPGPSPVPTWKGPARAPHQVTTRPGNFVVGAESISLGVQLMAGWAGDVWGSPELSAVVLALRSLFLRMWTQDWGTPFSRSLTQVGYFVLPSRTLPVLLDESLEAFHSGELGLERIALPPSGASAIQTLLGFRSSPWPLDPGPPLRRAGDQLVVDLRSASLWLDRLLTVDKDSPIELVKARATHFEELVQREIDNTPAAPPTDLRELRGRELRIGRKPVTDVDAVAVLDDVLLLVSCKSIVRSPELEAGIYSRTRNVRTDLEKYDAFWQERMAILRDYPLGDNYDFRGLEIVGVVCTSAVEFTHSEQFRTVIGDLSAVTSLAELSEFLRVRVS